VSDVDFLRRTVKVERPATPVRADRATEDTQERQDGAAWSGGHRRAGRTLAAYPSDGPLFTITTGEPLGYPTWRSIWAHALDVEAKARVEVAAKVRPHVETVRLDIDTHSLRHFYASALIAGGASVKVIQTRLGHGSAVVTLNTYGHLWPAMTT